MQAVIRECTVGNFNAAYAGLGGLVDKGYGVGDVIGVLMRLLKISDNIREDVKIEMLRVVAGFHLRAAEGIATTTQIGGLIANLCVVAQPIAATSSRE